MKQFSTQLLRIEDSRDFPPQTARVVYVQSRTMDVQWESKLGEVPFQLGMAQC